MHAFTKMHSIIPSSIHNSILACMCANYHFHTFMIYSCILFNAPLHWFQNSLYLSHASHHGELEGLANASTHHPYTSYCFLNHLDAFLFDPNTTPRINYVVLFSVSKKVAVQTLIISRKFIGYLCGTIAFP
jgi:hypothetical protein